MQPSQAFKVYVNPSGIMVLRESGSDIPSDLHPYHGVYSGCYVCDLAEFTEIGNDIGDDSDEDSNGDLDSRGACGDCDCCGQAELSTNEGDDSDDDDDNLDSSCGDCGDSDCRSPINEGDDSDEESSDESSEGSYRGPCGDPECCGQAGLLPTDTSDQDINDLDISKLDISELEEENHWLANGSKRAYLAALEASKVGGLVE